MRRATKDFWRNSLALLTTRASKAQHLLKDNPLRLAENRILVEQLRLIMGNFRNSLPALLVAALLLGTLSNGSNTVSLWLWCMAVILSNLNLQRYTRRHSAAGIPLADARRMAMLLGMLNAADGLIWSMLPWLTLDTASRSGFILVVAAYAGMLGAVLATHSPVPLMFVAFAIPEVVATTAKLWLLGQHTLSIGAFLYFASLLGQVFNSARFALAAIMVRFELAESHAKLREIEQRKILNQERQRLVQDMHDGLGSSLISTLRAVEHGKIKEAEIAHALRSCIDDLKLSIDSMESVEADLLLLLAKLRFRLEPRLESTGIALRWEVKNIPKLDWLDPTNAMHILRILQEAFANIIKHTPATEIRVATGLDNGGIVVAITDNGRGFDLEKGLNSGGRGLAHQMRRARAIGGKIQWDSTPQGTCLSLWLPQSRETQTF